MEVPSPPRQAIARPAPGDKSAFMRTQPVVAPGFSKRPTAPIVAVAAAPEVAAPAKGVAPPPKGSAPPPKAARGPMATPAPAPRPMAGPGAPLRRPGAGVPPPPLSRTFVGQPPAVPGAAAPRAATPAGGATPGLGLQSPAPAAAAAPPATALAQPAARISESPSPPLGSRPPPRRTDGPTQWGAARDTEAGARDPLELGSDPGAAPPPSHRPADALPAAPARAAADWPVAAVAASTPPAAPEGSPASDDGEPMTVRRPLTGAPPPAGGYVRKSSPSAVPTPSPSDSALRPGERLGRPAAAIPRAPALPREATEELEGSELERLKRALGRSEDRQRALQRDLDVVKAELATAAERYATLARSHETLQAQHESLRSLVAVRADRIRELEQAVSARDADKTRLADEHAAALAALAAAQRQELDQLRADHQRQLERQPAKKAPDDLRRIRGIGPKFAKALAAAGVVSFRQIAAWTEAEIAEISKVLKVHPARIAKDGWVASAAALVADDGEPAPAVAVAPAAEPEPVPAPTAAQPPPPAADVAAVAAAEEPAPDAPAPGANMAAAEEPVPGSQPAPAADDQPAATASRPAPGSIRPADDDVERSW
jgi:predicted flap endonuclease-1-like 5' DNA nuclease